MPSTVLDDPGSARYDNLDSESERDGRGVMGMKKFDLGVWVSVIVLVIAVVLTLLFVWDKFPI